MHCKNRGNACDCILSRKAVCACMLFMAPVLISCSPVSRYGDPPRSVALHELMQLYPDVTQIAGGVTISPIMLQHNLPLVDVKINGHAIFM